MKKQTGKAVVVEAPTKLKVGAGRSQVGKSVNRNKGRCSKPTPEGKSTKLLFEKDGNSSPSRSGSAEKLGPILLNEGNCLAETTKGFPIPEQNQELALHLSGKIKLQLFPLDEVTRIGLEKDGYHPYLELTLSARKKISSVLKHLNHKWGGSSIVTGEPILIPYNAYGDLGHCRWTFNDIAVSAGDVYSAIGSPSVFRLRYGWLSDCERKSFELQSTSAPIETSLLPEGTQKVCSSNTKSKYGKRKQREEASEELKPTIGSGTSDVRESDKTPSDELVEPAQNDGKTEVEIGQSSLWDDSFTNISISGLLSEASLQGRFTCDPKPDGSNAGLHPSQLISDSFDAFIMSQVNRSQAPRLPHGTCSSILDAEDTCHAFAFQKFSSSGKDAVALGGSAYSHNSSQDAFSKTFKNLNSSEFSVQSGLPQSPSCQESETDLSLCSRIYNDERSLGLSGIKWTDSLGPFDLGLSSSRKIISGDSLSISRIIS